MPSFKKLLHTSWIEFKFHTESMTPLLSCCHTLLPRRWVLPAVMTYEDVPIVYEINPPNQTPALQKDGLPMPDPESQQPGISLRQEKGGASIQMSRLSSLNTECPHFKFERPQQRASWHVLIVAKGWRVIRQMLVPSCSPASLRSEQEITFRPVMGEGRSFRYNRKL